MKKKILSFITLLCMVVALFPANMITVSADNGASWQVVFADWDGSVIKYVQVENGETLNESDMPKIKGYTCVLKYFGKDFDINTTITEDIRLEVFFRPLNEKYAYKIINGEAVITDWDPVSKEIIVPKNIDGYPVTKIGDRDSVNPLGGYSVESIVLPDCVKTIGDSAFCECACLTSVNIPDGVTSIGDTAFSSCYNLTSITIPSSVTSIGIGAFQNCTELTSVNLPNDMTSIKRNTFSHCNKLTSVTIPDSVTSIGNYAFSSCYNLTSITIPSGVTSIGDGAFASCLGLTSITIPSSVTSIGNGAFSSCSDLTSINVNKSNASYCSVGGNLFNKAKTELIQYAPGKSNTQYTIPTGITNICERAFSGCSSLTSVNLPDSITTIGDYAFSGCTGLTSITIPSGVTSIGNSAFSSCSGLTKVNITDINAWCNINFEYADSNPLSCAKKLYLNNTLITKLVIPSTISKINAYAFYGCNSITSVNIPSGVTSIGYEAFYNCTGLTSITIPNSVTSIGSYAFCNTAFYNNSSNWNNNVLYLGKYLLCAKETLSGKCTVKSGTTHIAPSAFYHCTGLTSVTIPDSVTSIGNSAFYYCYNLTSVIIGNGVTSIGNYAFSYCTGLTSITIPSGITSIGYSAFQHCKSLTSITIPESVTSIGVMTFYYCENLTNVNLPDSLMTIGGNAFNGCNNLESITIPAGVTSIDDWAFSSCTALTSIDVDENNTRYCSVDGNLFNKDETELIQYAVGKNDTQYVIPDCVTNIGIGAFSKCSGLTSVTIPDSVTSIGNSAFSNCSGLTSITIPSGVTSIGNSAFSNCSGLTSITIPSGVTSIGNSVFSDCSGLTSITIPSGVTSIDRYAFSYCDSLTNVYYNGTETEWNNISIDSKNTFLTNAARTYFAYIQIFDKNGNKVVEITQNMGETVDTSSITIPDGYKLVLCKDKEMTEEYSLDTPISENLSLYYDIIEINKLKITGTESADIGQKGITESVIFATDKTAKDFVATIKYSDKLNLSTITEKDFSIAENSSEAKNGYTYLYLTCTYKNDGNMPKNTTLNAFDLVFDVSESATANEKLTIEFVGDETFLADGGANTYDFDGLGTAEIKVNPIFVSGIAIKGADEIDKATQYTAVISPENATNKDIEWAVDNSDIATISADGILTPIKAGTVKITATAKDGSEVYGEKSVNVKVYAQITSLTASLGIWDKEFTSSEREYIIYVPKNTSSIKLNPQYNGALKLGTQTLYNNRKNNITLTGDETVLTLAYSEPGYTDSEYTINIVKFEGTKTTVSEDGKSFTVKPINIETGNTIILALYDGDIFVEMQSKPYIGEDIPFTTDKAYTKAKVMIWNSLESMTPICDVEIVK